MEDLENKLRIREDRGSKSKVKLKGKSGEDEDIKKGSRKEPKKEKLSLNAITRS